MSTYPGHGIVDFGCRLDIMAVGPGIVQVEPLGPELGVWGVEGGKQRARRPLDLGVCA